MFFFDEYDLVGVFVGELFILFLQEDNLVNEVFVFPLNKGVGATVSILKNRIVIISEFLVQSGTLFLGQWISLSFLKRNG